MEILFWHGYLLHGSGSNIFTLNIVEEFLKENNVYLFSQERKWDEIEGIASHWIMDETQNISIENKYKEKGFIGITPYIDNLLPVFVYDEYDGFEVKTFDKLTDKELDRYIDLNVKAIISFLKFNKIDIIYCNHFAISPYIMKKVWEKTGIPYIVIGHGSSLNYIISKDKRYMKLSYEAFLESKNVVVQSEYIRERSSEIYEEIDFFKDSRFKIIPSGVNFDQFNKKLTDNEFKKIVSEKKLLSNGPKKEVYDTIYRKISKLKDIEIIKAIIDKEESRVEYRDLDRDLLLKVPTDLGGQNNVLYIGKLIISKGVQTLLMSLPYVFERNPMTSIMIVGYGKFRPILEMLLRALIEGNRGLLEFIIENGEYFENGKDGELKYLLSFWNSLKENGSVEEYLKLSKKIDIDRVIFLGKLDHDILPYIIKKNHIIVVPSIFPESFGMVSIEGMSQGLIPIVYNHSGLKEVIPFSDSLVDLDDRAVNNLEKLINLNLENLKKTPNLSEKFILESKKYSFKSVGKALLDLN